jgi:light-regulated signal transduction histidine kinase (bacteriophytochrome)
LTDAPAELQQRYSAALSAHLEAGAEETLSAGYELGRWALEHGYGLLDVSGAHHSAIEKLSSVLTSEPQILQRASEFFAESLTPFEMGHLGFREAISELRRQNAELVLAKEKADSAMAELEAFSYSVSHDLRAPLRRIDGFSQLLQQDADAILSDDCKRYLTSIRHSAQHMSQLIDDLLRLAQVTRAELYEQDLDFSAMARAIEARLRQSEPERRVDFLVQDDVRAFGDRRLLDVALENLLGNAWKFSSKRAEARIEFGATVEHGKTIYYVRDNGAGFDMQYAGKLFGAFQRLHSPNDFEGTGIGLATVRRVIRRHGGRVWAESSLDRGATFYFTLHDD